MFTGLAARTLALVLLAASWSCARLPESTLTAGPGTVGTDLLPDSTSIPLAWGNLVSVTINPAAPAALQLWFQDAHGTVRAVVYNATKQRFSRVAGLIARH